MLTGGPVGQRRRCLLVLLVGSGLVGCGGDDGARAPAGSAGDTDRPTSTTATTATTATRSSSTSLPPLPLPPSSLDASSTAAPPAGGPGQPEGFELVTAEITSASGAVCTLCLWLADTPERRQRGLMGVTDLGPADGMVFRFTTASTSSFYMLDTPTPLSIAFFGADGSFVSATDMAPCLDPPATGCPVYPAMGAYTEALEVPAGGLDDVGVGPGSRLVVLDEPCPSP